jgi:8-oxo-dGTP diphosphatase
VVAVFAHNPELHVAAGVLQDPAGRVLVAQRPAGGPEGGAWEFPGGKILAAETALQGLVRELREELAIEVRYARHLIRYFHDYPERRVHLYVWRVLAWVGRPRGAEGQALQWLEPGSLLAEGLLPADADIVNCLLRPAPVNGTEPLIRF